MLISNHSQRQHYLESSTRQRELLSLMNNLVLLGGLATSNSLQPGYFGRPPPSMGRLTQKRAFQFGLFSILTRTNDLKQYRRNIKDNKQLRQASRVLFKFNPSTLLAWLVETAVVLDLTWGGTVGGLKISPRFYVQVPDSHHFMKAVRTGDMSLVRDMIRTNAVSGLCMTSAGWTPLHVSHVFQQMASES